jgi:hypothetical protein
MGVTFMVLLAVLSAGFGSLTPLETLTLFVMVLPRAVESTFTTTVTVALLPLFRVPRLQVNAPPEGREQLPWLAVLETTVTTVVPVGGSTGNVSATVTPVAGIGPLLVTVIV